VFSPAAPERSLVLRKAMALVPAWRWPANRKRWRQSYRRLRRWIAQGAAYGESNGGTAAIVVEPREQLLHAGASQQLQVTAIDGLRQAALCDHRSRV